MSLQGINSTEKSIFQLTYDRVLLTLSMCAVIFLNVLYSDKDCELVFRDIREHYYTTVGASVKSNITEINHSDVERLP